MCWIILILLNWSIFISNFKFKIRTLYRVFGLPRSVKRQCQGLCSEVLVWCVSLCGFPQRCVTRRVFFLRWVGGNEGLQWRLLSGTTRGHSARFNLGENNEQMLSELGKKYWVPPTRAPFGRGRLVATWRSWHEARWRRAPLVSGFLLVLRHLATWHRAPPSAPLPAASSPSSPQERKK